MTLTSQSGNEINVIVGLGQTGLSCARHFAHANEPFKVIDSRPNPPGLRELEKMGMEIEVELGDFSEASLRAAGQLIVSPGVDLRLPPLSKAIAEGVPVRGDVDIFARAMAGLEAPMVAVTGSNAKSTVVTLLGEMAKQAGLKVAVAGNIGLPVLDLLRQERASLYVLELSSFQLQTTTDLGAQVATVLNMSPDHLDRYDSMQDYHRAKHRIFQGCQQAVVNRDDPLSKPLLPAAVRQWSFGLSAGDFQEFGLETINDEAFLSFNGEPLLPASALQMKGRHNLANALAAVALGHAAGLPMAAMIAALREFPGLPHRCQWVREKDGVNYYNDSKGTNVGACIAAIEGLGGQGKIVLLAGGAGKGADFGKLRGKLSIFGRLAILFGEDAEAIRRAIEGSVLALKVDSLEEAVREADRCAQPGDVVLLSPACASYDMFSNFAERGEAFMDAVRELH